MYTEEDRSKEVITKDTTLDLVSFLIDSKGKPSSYYIVVSLRFDESFLLFYIDDLEIKNILNKYNLVDEAIPAPELKEILNNIDYLVDNASTSIKV
jgi:hypothetical protein